MGLLGSPRVVFIKGSSGLEAKTKVVAINDDKGVLFSQNVILSLGLKSFDKT